jgi:hypothetical protein
MFLEYFSLIEYFTCLNFDTNQKKIAYPKHSNLESGQSYGGNKLNLIMIGVITL